MEQKTSSHLRIAARNRDLARTLLVPPQAGLEPTPWEWVAVIVFYSAVHLVNAYLWERYLLEPRNHDERTHGVQQDPGINICRRSYGVLKDAGYHARYTETYSLSAADAKLLLELRLRDVEATVMQALGQPVPVW